MIVGLGIDIVKIARIRKAMENPRFVYRILTDAEIALCNGNPARVAGRWAAKEAVFKATGVSLKWQEIEVLNDHVGAPHVTIRSNNWDGKRLRLNVSITHERNNAAAVAVLERIVIQVPTP